MPTRRLASVLGLLAFLVANVSAETLTFVAQFDPDLGSTNYSWFSPANWWVGPSTALVPAGRVPQANETAIVTGEADAAMSGIRVFSLVLTNGAALKNGTFAAEWLELRSDSSFSDARVNVLTFLRVGGTNCSLRATTLNILAIASGAFSPLAPAASASLNLDRGSVLVIAGSLSLAEGSLVNTLGPPQSRLVIAITPF